MEDTTATQTTSAEAKLTIGVIQIQHSFLMGKILTIIEASTPDKEQRKAVKDLVRGTFRLQQDWLGKLAHDESDARYSGRTTRLDPYVNHLSPGAERESAAQG